MTLAVPVGPPTVTINRDDRVVVCQPDGRIDAAEQEGFFARDSRFISGYEFLVNGRRPVLLNSSAIEFFSSRFEFTNPDLIDEDGVIPRETLSLRLDRTVAGGVHEDYDLINYSRRPIRITLEIAITSDFADVFDVRQRRLVRRGEITTLWSGARRSLRTTYTNKSFRRSLLIQVDKNDSKPQFANGRLTFVATIEPKGVWHTCLRWLPLTQSGRYPSTLDCSALTTHPEDIAPPLPSVSIESPNETVVRTWRRSVRDMDALRLEDPQFERGVFIPAAGVPWFVTLFGRDALVVSMQGISGFPELAAGALRRLSTLQATEDDPERDMEPGKIPHEIRHGELAQLGILPFTPYYGTHDATSLFVIVVSYIYQWLGDIEVLQRYLPAAEAAMAWIDRSGDLDGDGFQEYRTRSRHGYYNQGWKDAGDAIVEADGTISELPIGVCELQGYAYDAKLRLADIYDTLGRPEQAEPLRKQARTLYERFNNDFWWEREGTYYLGLNGAKKGIESVASNAGHCLASGIVPADRAGRVVERLMAEDMWSGWGIRTLSSDHVAYNPFSYHTGTVWPHDNAMIAGGFRRYGYAAEAARVARGLFDAAERFVANRLPELFAGLPRQRGSFPVQYLEANVPQAWAAAAVFRLIAILCGIHASAGPDRHRLYVDPALPDWLPSIRISNLRAGRGSLTLTLEDGTVEVVSNSTGFEVVHGRAPRPEAPPLGSVPPKHGKGGPSGRAAKP